MFLITLSLMFLFLTHPMSMGIVLIAQTISIAIYIGMNSLNFWFSYILILILVGAMLILFIYMTSIASNEKFNFSQPMTISLMIMLAASTLINLKSDLNSMMTNPLNNFNIALTKFYNMPSNMLTISLVIYLLITLIAVTSICKSTKSPLRQKF